METAKLYIDTDKGLMDQESLVATAQVLTALAEDRQDDITFTADEHGPHFLVPVELFDQFRQVVDGSVEPKKTRRGRKPKAEVVEPEVVAAAEVLTVTETDLEE